MPPLLTIAIPTYKRSKYLLRLLESLMPQLAGEARVELLVSDNASPDDTPEVLAIVRGRGLLFRSIRNQANIGPDRNFIQCFVEASGRYFWIIGDDDIVLPDGVSVLLGLLAEEEFDIVHLRAKDIVEGAEPYASVRGARIKRFEGALAFTQRTHVFLTFITGNIVNRERVLSLPHAPFVNIADTNLVQLGWTYTVVRFLRKGAYILDPLIAAGAEDRGGYALFHVFGTDLKRITEDWLVEPELVRAVLNGVIQTFFPGFILRNRMQQGAFAGEPPDALLASLFGDNNRYKLFLYPMLKLPIKLARAWLLLCRIVNRVDKAIGNPMLR